MREPKIAQCTFRRRSLFDLWIFQSNLVGSLKHLRQLQFRREAKQRQTTKQPANQSSTGTPAQQATKRVPEKRTPENDVPYHQRPVYWVLLHSTDMSVYTFHECLSVLPISSPMRDNFFYQFQFLPSPFKVLLEPQRPCLLIIAYLSQKVNTTSPSS